MSYNLEFWRYAPGISLDHQEVCEKLGGGQKVSGIAILPTLEIRQNIADAFAQGWQLVADDSWQSDQTGFFQLYTTSQFVEAVCYSMEGEDMNKIIDVMLKFNCPLYDPQVGQRFDGG